MKNKETNEITLFCRRKMKEIRHSAKAIEGGSTTIIENIKLSRGIFG